MRKIPGILLLFLLLIFTSKSKCETFLNANDSLKTIRLKEITVTSYKQEPIAETALLVIPLQVDSFAKLGNYNLSDMLAKIPGVNLLSTGAGISKPVIRGLYGNRIMTLISGLRFDNQQWQDEHGLGLSEIGISKVELIKGPMSVLYGSEAMGGIVNIIEEQKPDSGKTEIDYGVKLFSNTLGGLTQFGYKTNRKKSWFRIRAGIENNGDYSDGKGKRVTNTRFDGYYLKASYGFTRKKWTSTNHFHSSLNRFGFVFKDAFDFITPDARWSRRMQVNPNHIVILNLFNSENTIVTGKRSKLIINAGFQSNQRMENEGGGAISLNMVLLTAHYLARYEINLNAKQRLIFSQLTSFENNTNFGMRKIVPDARMFETNASAYLETNLHEKWIWENGLGAGQKAIHTFFTPNINDPGKEIRPFQKSANYQNLFTGISWLPSAVFNMKANLSSGVRIPNLAELSSNGLHEGIYTFEIGNPLLKNEYNIMGNLHAEYSGNHLGFFLSPFINRFYNYVYLAPTSEDWYGFPVYRFRQQNALQYGSEAGVYVASGQGLKLGCNASGMMSKTDDGLYTPYVPATRISPYLYYTIKAGSRYLRINLNGDYCLAQKRTYPGEVATADYFLLNANINTTLNTSRGRCELSLGGSNLLNRAYYDNLSRFKSYGLLNIGRNIFASLRWFIVKTQ